MAGFTIEGNIVDIPLRKIFFGKVKVVDEKIGAVEHLGPERTGASFIMPGFIDSHIHIESSMLVPSEFARLAVVHGTVATVSDPHEIANVCGIDGVEYMIENGRTVPFKFFFGAPSCVPATSFETAGAALDAQAVRSLLARDEIKYLSEMMNFPGVLNEDPEVMNKIQAAHHLLKPVDGHAPGLRGEQAKNYISAGISTDHECFTREEALDKLAYGMKIIIREGSAAKNFEALIGLLNEYHSHMMFCSDDKHPDSLVDGHINKLCARAVSKGIDVFNVLQAACINPVNHYKLGVGTLKAGDLADMILVKDLTHFEIERTYIDGVMVAENGISMIHPVKARIINNFSCRKRSPEDFTYPVKGSHTTFITESIEALDGQLITNKMITSLPVINGEAIPDAGNDTLMIAVVNRYSDHSVAKGFIKNFGLKTGAIASSVAHDSHNIVAVGVDKESICRAVNLVIEHKGGVSCCSKKGNNWNEDVLPLPVAGLMTNEDGYKVAEAYTRIDAMAKSLGSKLSAPFMTLSFMALLVIPHLKMSDL